MSLFGRVCLCIVPPLVAFAACGPAFEESGGGSGGSAANTATTTGAAGGDTMSVSATSGTGGGTSGAGKDGDDCELQADGDIPPCEDGLICLVEGCEANTRGKCVKEPIPDATAEGAVCGCDGMSYWNAALAVQNGQAIRADGRCEQTAETTQTCAKMDLACPVEATCGRGVDSCMDILGPAARGLCWVLPGVCPGGDGKENTFKICGAGQTECMSECDAIKSGGSNLLAKVYVSCGS